MIFLVLLHLNDGSEYLSYFSLFAFAVIPSARCVKYRGVEPKFDGAFVASSATVVGKVTVGAKSSIWYGAVLRGDDNTITIGEGVSIGDRVMIHCSSGPVLGDKPTVIGNRAVVGAGAILHGNYTNTLA